MDRFVFNIGGYEQEIYRFVYPFINSNMYVLLTGKEAIVFDPHEEEKLLELMEDHHIEHVHILLTHEHYDHVSGVNWLREATDAKIYCNKDAACSLAQEHTKIPPFISTVIASEDRKDGGNRYQNFKAHFKPYSIVADNTFDKIDNFEIETLHFEVTSTPGHSPGSTCYKMNDHFVFTGDSLLQNTPVILGFRESRKEQYENITLPYLRNLPKETIILPGHGEHFKLNETSNI